MTRRRVDSPLPLGPSSAVRDPSGTSIDTSSRATKSPNRLVAFSTVIPISDFLSACQRSRVADGDLAGGLRGSVPPLNQVHAEEDQQRHDREDDRGRVGAGDVEVLVLVLDQQGGGLGLALDLPGDHGY